MGVWRAGHEGEGRKGRSTEPGHTWPPAPGEPDHRERGEPADYRRYPEI